MVGVFLLAEPIAVFKPASRQVCTNSPAPGSISAGVIWPIISVYQLFLRVAISLFLCFGFVGDISPAKYQSSDAMRLTPFKLFVLMFGKIEAHLVGKAFPGFIMIHGGIYNYAIEVENTGFNGS
jgi:hypothetical protein